MFKLPKWEQDHAMFVDSLNMRAETLILELDEAIVNTLVKLKKIGAVALKWMSLWKNKKDFWYIL